MDGTEYGSGHIPSRGLMIEYPNMGSGHAGNDTSRERQEREDASGITAETQKLALRLLGGARSQLGMTASEFEDLAGIGHGRASSALSHLHRAGHIRRIKERRQRHEVYVLPEHVDGREESPYRPRVAKLTVTPTLKQEAIVALDAAARARAGDSNDEEIESLWECADLLAQTLNLEIPEYE